MNSEFPHDPRSRVVHRSGEILVTGATGLLGRHVCALLGEAGRRHRALVRVTSDRDVLAGTSAWMTEGDVTRIESLKRPMENVETVVHLAGVVRNKDPALNESVHVTGTRNVLAAARAAGVTRIVAVSSDTVLRSRRGIYAETKRKAEALLRAAEGLEVVVLRPPMMLGPRSPHVDSLRKAARLPVLPMPGGTAPRRPVAVQDVAAAVVRAVDLDGERLPIEPIDLPGAEAVSFGALVGLVARATGRRAPVLVPIPQPALRRTARLAERLLKDPPLTVERLEGMAEEPAVDGRLARELLDWNPRSAADAVRAALP